MRSTPITTRVKQTSQTILVYKNEGELRLLLYRIKKDIYVCPLEKDFRSQLGLAADAGRSALGPADGLEKDTWAEKEFGGAPLGDARLSRRLVNVAGAKADEPWRAFCGVAQGDWAAVKAYYRLIDMPEESAATMANILRPHRERTVRRMQAQRAVLCVQDGSDLNYNDLAECEGLGAIGANQTGAKSRGLHFNLSYTQPYDSKYFSRNIMIRARVSMPDFGMLCPTMVVSPKSDSENSRLAAARILSSWLKSGIFPDRELDAVETSRAFIMELALGIVRWYGALNWIRDRWVSQRPRAEVEACLLVGLYQLLFMDDVQEYAALHETVEAARWIGGEKVAGFINAVLRRAQADKEKTIQALKKQPAPIRLSHPPLLIERWTKRFGADAAIRLCEWNNRRAEVVLRWNKGLASAEPIAGRPHPFAPYQFLILPHGVNVTSLPGFADGGFYVQDPATSVAPALLNPRPGETVLDACAAPGGKTMQLAERMEGRGTLVAMDPSVERLKPLRENIARLKWNFIDVVEGDIAKRKWTMRFNAILLDVPCTNTGVIRRRPDARWRFSPERLRAACDRQAAILDAAAAQLEVGGRLVYSTCSLEPEENEEQVDRWLRRHSEFERLEARRLFPPDSGTDGVYAALLAKRR